MPKKHVEFRDIDPDNPGPPVDWADITPSKRRDLDGIDDIDWGYDKAMNDAEAALHEAARTIRQAEAQLKDYSDIIHVRPRTWGGPHPAPTKRPWSEGAGVGDDDPSGHQDDDGNELTNAQWESKLDEYRANGQTVEMRNQLGLLRAPGQDSWAKGVNRDNAKREREDFRKIYPSGCPHCGKG